MNTYDSLLLIRRGSNWEIYHNGLRIYTTGVPVVAPTKLLLEASHELLRFLPIEEVERMAGIEPIEGLLQYTTKHDK